MIKSQTSKLPNSPGVYFFKKGKEILYIGKATSLKDRVKSYFGKDLIGTRGPILVDMVFQADKIDWEETDSVLEALILEAFLIKKYQPKYNTKEKSDKSFNYVCITRDRKIAIVRGRLLNEKKYNAVFGPFPSGSQLREALRIIRKIFPYIEERRGTKGRDEFYKQIRLVPADSLENKNNIKNIKLFFEGKKKKVLKNLEKEMKLLAKNKEFERAGEVKRQIFALKHINDIALIKNETSSSFLPLRPSLIRIEAYDIAHMSGKNMVGVMTVIEEGEVNKSEYKKFKIRTQAGANDVGALIEVLERRLAHKEWQYPDIIVVDGSVAQINAAKKVLSGLDLRIDIVSVVKDERHRPKAFQGKEEIIKQYKREILLANSEAHRFAISYHKNMRAKNFL